MTGVLQTQGRDTVTSSPNPPEGPRLAPSLASRGPKLRMRPPPASLSSKDTAPKCEAGLYRPQHTRTGHRVLTAERSVRGASGEPGLKTNRLLRPGLRAVQKTRKSSAQARRLFLGRRNKGPLPRQPRTTSGGLGERGGPSYRPVSYTLLRRAAQLFRGALDCRGAGASHRHFRQWSAGPGCDPGRAVEGSSG